MSTQIAGAAFLIMLAAQQTMVVLGQECINPPDLQSSLSCNVSKETRSCGWKDVNNSEVTHSWGIEYDKLLVVFNYGDYANSTAKLMSPTICTTHRTSCFLQFSYGIFQDVENCTWSVLTSANNRVLWSSTDVCSRVNTRQQINITDQGSNFILYFVAKKLKTDLYCRLLLSNIVFECPGNPATSSSTSAQAVCESITENQALDNEGLSAGAVAGIVLILLGVVAVTVVVVFMLRKRATNGRIPVPKFLTQLWTNSPPSGNRSVANSACIGADDVIPVLDESRSAHAGALAANAKMSGSNLSDSYKIVGLGDTAAYYNTQTDPSSPDNYNKMTSGSYNNAPVTSATTAPSTTRAASSVRPENYESLDMSRAGHYHSSLGMASGDDHSVPVKSATITEPPTTGTAPTVRPENYEALDMLQAGHHYTSFDIRAGSHSNCPAASVTTEAALSVRPENYEALDMSQTGHVYSSLENPGH